MTPRLTLLTMRRLPISNRKLYKLGLGMFVFMGFFLAYLIFSDIYRTQIDGTKYRQPSARINPVPTIQKRPHGNLHGDLKYPSKHAQKGLKRLTNPEIHYTTSTFKVSHNNNMLPVQHSSTGDPIGLKRSLQTSLNHKFQGDPSNIAHPLPKHVLSPTHRKSGLIYKNSVAKNTTPDPVINTESMVADLANLQDDGKQYLIYLCHSLTWCGGWGDRQRGITSTYFLSRTIGREFKIIMTTPCNLSKFYRPYNVNWIWDNHAVTNASFIIKDIFSKSDFRSLISNGDFNALFPQKVVYIKTNHDYHSILMKNPHYMDFVKKHKATLTKKGRFRWAWNDLMQPSQYLLERLQNVVGSDILIRKGLLEPSHLNPTPEALVRRHRLKQRGSSTLICAHVRFGRNPTMPMDEDFDSFKPSDIPQLQHFLKSKDKTGDARFFVATDFEGVRTEFRRFFGDKLIDYGGKILHIDRQRSERNACVGFEVALLDQLVLSVCDVLVISRSGFSIHASHVSNRTEPLYIMEDSVISPFKG